MRAPFRDADHLVRVAGLFVAAFLLFLVVRQFLVPADFGVYGHFRAGAIADNQVRPVKFAGQADCLACHDDVGTKRAAGKHARVACEACHGALAAHAADPETKPARPDGRSTCLVCHTANVAKPAGFPQIVPKEHAETGLCVECHSSHEPGSPPEESK
jgi:hypothetical protein